MTVKDVSSSSSWRAIIPSCSGRALPATSFWRATESGRCTAGFAGRRPRFRVEASPDAEFVLINGNKMAAGSIRQGDEIAIGSCRIFLLRNDDTIDVRQSMRAVDDERTRVLAAPFVPVEAEERLRATGLAPFFLA